MNTAIAPNASRNPWLGLAAYDETDAGLFFGRGVEIDDLVARISDEPLTTCFGPSGAGKTSLLRAGVFPRLRARQFLPVYIRLDHSDSADGYFLQAIRAIGESADRNGIDREMLAEPMAADDPETLWEWLHRHDFWDARNNMIRPVLVFDQFEEIFTLGGTKEVAAEFFDQLADLCENSVPAHIQSRLKETGSRLEIPFDEQNYRVVISLREDFLARLEETAARLPSLRRNRFGLGRMTGEQAIDAVLGPGAGLVSEAAAREVVWSVAAAGNAPAASGSRSLRDLTVEPALLSLFCRELNARRIDSGAPEITVEQVAGSGFDILDGFYQACLESVSPATQRFVEDRLLTSSGFRNQIAVEDLGDFAIPLEEIEQLVDRRLLHFEQRQGLRWVEFSHDVLTGVAAENRAQRRLLEEREALVSRQREEMERERRQAEELRAQQEVQRRHFRIMTTVTALLAVALLGTIAAVYVFFLQEQSAFYRGLTKGFGFPRGLDRISRAEAQRLPVSYQFFRRGLDWTHWPPQWNPPHRVLAVNGYLIPTTQHDVGTYLWSGAFESGDSDGESESAVEKGQELGLHEVCQWEFVPDESGAVAYERGLDRHGRMIWGFVYSPMDDPGKRLGRFIGADGFPLMQRRQSAAEFVSIEYDENGFERELRFLDARREPATGPDAAYGRKFAYDEDGRMTSILSIDGNGNEMIDKAGNCGMKLAYDERGLLISSISVGTDGGLKAVKEGYTISKVKYDELGRGVLWSAFDETEEPVFVKQGYHLWTAGYDERGNQIEIRYYGVAGEPVLHRDGNHGWRVEYDGRGKQVSHTWLGLDGNPMLLPGADYATCRSEFDEHGNEIRRTFHGVGGERVLHAEGYHGWEAAYDKNGNQISNTWVDLGGAPVLLPDGDYATFRCDFDDRGKMIRQEYFGVSGDPVLHRNGNHGRRMEYDERGNLLCQTWLGLDGNPMLLPGSDYATHRSVFDDRGNEIQRTFHGVSGEPVLCEQNFHGWRSEYDKRGDLTSQTWLGLDGNPVLFPGADYATHRSVFDDRGKEIQRTFHGILGEPVLHADGNHGWRAEFDKRGNQVSQTWLGLNSEPMLRHGKEYAIYRSVFDGNDNEIRRTHFGTRGEPVWNEEGIHGWEAGYDKRGYRVSMAAIDVDEEPMALPGGSLAKIASVFDERGNEVVQNYYGVDGEPVLHADGNHGWKAEYNETGNRISQTWLGLDGKPILLPGTNHATRRSVFDPRGNEIQRAHFGVSGEPVLLEDGSHGWKAERDEAGKLVSLTWFDREGATLPGGPVARITEVTEASPARAAGIREGDVLLRYGHWSFFPRESFPLWFEKLDRAIEEVEDVSKEVVVWRDGEILLLRFESGSVGIRYELRFKREGIVERLARDWERCAGDETKSPASPSGDVEGPQPPRHSEEDSEI